MRRHSVPTLLCALLITTGLQAEESNTSIAAATPTPAIVGANSTDPRIVELEGLLENSERQRIELEANKASHESEQLLQLSQENLQLKLKLKEAQAQQQPRFLSEQQTWFALGGGGALLCVLFGALLRGKRRQQSQWFN